MLVVLMLSFGMAGSSCRINGFEAVPALAVIVTACAVVTEATVAVNVALVALARTVTEAGTVTAALLLDKLTLNPPAGAAEVNVTVQLSLPEPVMEEVLQVNPLKVALTVATPVRGRTVVIPLPELLEIVSWPAAAPAVVGSNCTLRLAVWPGVNVRGKLGPDRVKPAPVTAAEPIVTGAVPVEDKTSVWFVVVFTATLPNATVVALTLSVGVYAFS